MRIFVSMPVKDWSREKIAEERQKVLDGAPGYFKLGESDVIEVPMIEPWQLKGQHPVYCLGLNLQMLSQADVAIFHPDWCKSKACRFQHDICEAYGIKHIDLSWEPKGER